MKTQSTKLVLRTGLCLLVFTATVAASWAKPSGREVVFEAYSSPTSEETWEGPAAIWIDGLKYAGSVTYYHDQTAFNDNSWHGFETQVLDFGELGMLEISGPSKTSFQHVTPDHRWHLYSSSAKITVGTGAFENAHGVFQSTGYTDWLFPAPPVAPVITGFGGGKGMIIGIDLPESLSAISAVPEPSSLLLLGIGVLGTLTCTIRRRRKPDR